jgi:hypothetical protein
MRGRSALGSMQPAQLFLRIFLAALKCIINDFYDVRTSFITVVMGPINLSRVFHGPSLPDWNTLVSFP